MSHIRRSLADSADTLTLSAQQLHADVATCGYPMGHNVLPLQIATASLTGSQTDSTSSETATDLSHTRERTNAQNVIATQAVSETVLHNDCAASSTGRAVGWCGSASCMLCPPAPPPAWTPPSRSSQASPTGTRCMSPPPPYTRYPPTYPTRHASPRARTPAPRYSPYDDRRRQRSQSPAPAAPRYDDRPPLHFALVPKPFAPVSWIGDEVLCGYELRGPSESSTRRADANRPPPPHTALLLHSLMTGSFDRYAAATRADGMLGASIPDVGYTRPAFPGGFTAPARWAYGAERCRQRA